MGFYLDFNLLRNFYDINTQITKNIIEHDRNGFPEIWTDSDILWYRSHILGILRKIRSSAAKDDQGF